MTQSPKNSPLDEDSGEFACFDTLDSLAAYCHHKYGEAFVRQAFKPDPNPGPAYPGGGPREQYEKAADKLEQRGLDHVALILRDLAQQALSGIDLPPSYCSAENWRSKWLLQRKIDSGEMERELRRKYRQTHRQSQTNRQKPANHQR